MGPTIIPDVVQDQEIHALREANTAFEAAQHMTKYNSGAIVVVSEGGLLVGIVTERDITRRIVAVDLNANDAPLSEIMTRNPDTLAPEDTAATALRLMQERHYRHMPVVRDGKVIGMVSMRDLYGTAYRSLLESAASP